ncbi:MAG: hypothetical protein RJA22_923 [Verrucomicrobiota bacterium]|jgi:hypothetical protein
MTPTRILPDLQCSLLCEEVRQEANGNVFLLGILDVVRVPQLPITAAKLCVFNRWTAGVGVFTEAVRLIAPDQTTVLCKSEVKFQMKDPNLSATTVTLFGNVQFANPGAYTIEVLVDDVMKLRYPINLVVVPPPGGPAATPPPTTTK